MTSVLPASHTEIAAVAEAAGQLGIATPNVVAFTKTMIDLGETTNLTAEEAATQLARFVNVMGTSQSQVSNLGAAPVELGYNYATTEAEILAMAQRLSGAGVQIGMSEGQVLGLSRALSSVGIEAEAGGSAMSKVMIDIASSVDKGGDRLEKFASVAGVSADQFAAKWRSDPGEALATFVKGLANAEAQGNSTFGILEELGITEVRMRDALLRSASAADQFSSAMQMGNSAFEENTALVDEANNRYETTASKLGVARNQAVELAISFGEHLLPAIEFAADGVGTFTNLLSGLDGPMGAVVAWGAVASASVLLGGGAMMATVPKVAVYKVAPETLGWSASSAVDGIGRVTGALGNPWVLGVTAAASIVGFLVAEQNRLSSQAKALADALDGRRVRSQRTRKRGLRTNCSSRVCSLQRSVWGISARDMTQAWLGNADALEIVNGRLDKFRKDADFHLEHADWKGWSDDLVDVGYALDGSNKVLAEAKTRQQELAEATGQSSDASDSAASSVQNQADSLGELQGSAQQTLEAIADLADQIRNFGKGAFDMEGSAIKLQGEYQKLTDAFAAGGQSLDITTEAGRNTVSSLLDVAAAANASAGATLEMTGSQEQANAVLDEARQKIVDARVALGESPEVAAAWADQFLSSSQAVNDAAEASKVAIEDIPDEKKIYVDADTADALEGVEGVSVVQIDDKTFAVVGHNDDAITKITEVIDNNPQDKLLRIDADNAKAFEGIDGVNVRVVNKKTAVVWGENSDAVRKIEEINEKQTPGKTVWIGADGSGFRGVWDSIMRLGPIQKIVNFVKGTSVSDNANGGIYAYANGGIYAYANGGIEAYAGGGFATGIYKGGAPIHKFAEPETVWEACISGKPDQRERNRQIWVETGERLGMGAGGQATVYVPTSVTVKDADNRLIGTMAVVADQRIDGYAEEQAQAGWMVR